VARAIVTELSARGHGSEEMAAVHNALVQFIALKRVWLDVGHAGSHVYVFIAELAHVQIHIVQELVGIAVGRRLGGDGR